MENARVNYRVKALIALGLGLVVGALFFGGVEGGRCDCNGALITAGER